MRYVMVQIPKTPAPASPVPRSVPTSADVARLAGVSRATVSYVLNNTSAVRISEPTRRRVHEAAKELGYVPHAAARSLRAGHSRMVLMPAPSFPVGPLYHQFISDLQWELGRLDYTVVQYGAVGLQGDEAARSWAELRPVAVLVPGSGLGPKGVTVLKRSGARAVVTLGPESVEGAHALLMDHEAVGRCAATHLHARGRRRIGVVVPQEPGLESFSAPRLEGVRSALRGTAATVTELPLAYDEMSAARLAARWSERGLDAVFAYNDEYAMLLMRALQDEGVDIPGDTAVIGADDLMLGRLLRPRLTTVNLELPSGRDLAELVDRAVRDPGGAPETHKVLGASVVHRDSS
ncbi:LacI family DNA-binding transcriptional regulator [Streptomyces sp. ALI-76-A]|jgi:DNA-binding LacI/PurR family transcriptional regulator|uniref:LacI family DNA-binding transcriptional regulator n=1 Tax=Streptomyces sp. ALI-76-A TaxID=3025736 RepID=UPI00256F5254|nr:LacI family DNA-binding transcriptional regulator [Streptomyces sp. ALI-76-A]MDL5205229.1 LacI family DNA-binding transcriptional regulator [Streptomyces sp. ALI-76-A]